MKDLQIIQNDDGVFDVYDDTYDITIHCTSQEEHNKALKMLNNTQDILQKIKQEIKQLVDYDTVDVLVDVMRIINKHMQEVTP